MLLFSMTFFAHLSCGRNRGNISAVGIWLRVRFADIVSLMDAGIEWKVCLGVSSTLARTRTEPFEGA
jgi:hypothetical protein